MWLALTVEDLTSVGKHRHNSALSTLFYGARFLLKKVSDFSFESFKFLCCLAAIDAFLVVFLFDASSACTEFNGFL